MVASWSSVEVARVGAIKLVQAVLYSVEKAKAGEHEGGETAQERKKERLKRRQEGRKEGKFLKERKK